MTGKTGKDKKKKLPDVITMESTIHISPRVRGVGNKRRAPRAIKVIKDLCRRTMGTKDNRIDVKLNKYMWRTGIKNVPNRVRVRMSRKVHQQTEGGARGRGKLYTIISLAPPSETLKGKITEIIKE